MGLAIGVFLGLAPPARATGPVELFRFQDSRISESSGVATASYRNDLIFTHNDSGDGPRFFAVDFTGKTLATYTVAGPTAVDWEDMARGPHNDGTPGQSLYFADTGNNLRDRAVLSIYEVDEPVVGVTPETLPLRGVLRVKFPDIRHDAETLLVNQTNGQILIVAKEFYGLSNVYQLGNNGAFKVATVNIVGRMTLGVDALIGPSTFTGSPSPLPGTQITGGAIGPAGDRIILRTYLEAFEFPLVGANYAAAFAATPNRLALPKTTQGESATYTNDGTGFLTTTEGVGGPVHRMQTSFTP